MAAQDMYIHDIADAGVTVWDPNTIIVSSGQVGDVSTVTIAGGLATTNLTTCCAFLLPLEDRAGTRINGADQYSLFSAIEVTAAPGATSDLWVCSGTCEKTDLSIAGVRGGGGILWDQAPGPTAYCVESNLFRLDAGGPQATAIHAGYADSHPSVRTFYPLSTTFDAAWTPVGSTYRGAITRVWAGLDLYRFVALGRYTNIAGNATISFSSWWVPTIMRQSGTAPPTTG